MYKKIINNKAFTLIELIIVVGIIGILVGIASPRFTGYTEKARIAKHANNASVLENSVEIFNIENGRYPRLSEVAYTADEVESFSENVRDLSGKEVTLDADGKYYDLDYLAIDDSISIPDDEKASYILQNPKGKVYYLEGLSEEGEIRAESRIYTKEQVEKMISKEGYIPVASAKELDNIRNEKKQTFGEGTDWVGKYKSGLNGKYIQVADIKLSGYDNWAPIGNAGEGGDPKDEYVTNGLHFTGIYNGGGFKIIDMKINNPKVNYQGLFGYTLGASLKNVGLENVNVKGNRYVGGLVGNLYEGSTIENSYTTGVVNGSKYFVGGLAGEVWNNSSINNSYSACTVSGYYATGGLAGQLFINSTVNNSYSTGDVTSIDNRDAGGLIGDSYKSMTKNSYSTGKVKSTHSGGFIGNVRLDDIEAKDSYWDVTSSGKTNGLYSGDDSRIEGKSTSEMKKQSTYKDWDFNNTWTMGSNGYPILQWQ